MKGLAAAMVLVGVLGACRRGAAQQDWPPQIVGVQVGFEGRYKPGLWTPVRVFLRGGGRAVTYRLAVVAPDGDGVPCRVLTPAEPPCRLGPGEEKSDLLYVRLGRTESSLAVEVRDVELPEGSQVIAERVFEAGAGLKNTLFAKALPSSDRLVLVVGPDPMGAEEAVGVLRRHAGDHATVVHLGLKRKPGGSEAEDGQQKRFHFSQMPDRWYGYEGVEVVVLSTGQPEIYQGLRPDGPQIAALNQWVHLGGTLVVCVGRHAAELLGEGAPLQPFLPGKLQQMLPLRQANALESYCGSREPVWRAAGGKPEMSVPQLGEVQGTVEAREGNLPLVVRRTVGFGRVVFAAVDLDLPPLSQWPGRLLLMRKLLDISESPVAEAAPSSAVMHFGFDDMAGQLRSALDQFAGIPAVPFWLVVAVFLGYLVLIGPVDYFLVRKVLRRMEWTWLTFPPLVLACCGAAYVAAHGLKGDQLRINQVDLVDVDVPSKLVRGTSWANVFSPLTHPYDIAFQPGGAGWQPAPGSGPGRADLLVSWFGLPGSGLGGMSPKTAGPVSWEQPYEESPRLDRLVGLPVQVWSTKSLCARWTGRAEPGVAAELAEQSRTPVGTVRNRLGFPLWQCLLVYGHWVYELGTLRPGQSVSIGTTHDRRELRSFLMQVEGDDKGAGRYDQASTDPVYILRIMSFFEAVGGFRHTGLTNRYQGFVDLSDLLKANCAVLVAQGPADDPQSPSHGARWLCDGRAIGGPQDRHTTMYRFVFPVNRPTAGPE
jgi:hypothetical protein